MTKNSYEAPPKQRPNLLFIYRVITGIVRAATNNEVLAALPGINLRNIAHVRKAYGYPAIAIPSAVGDANRNWLMEESARLGVGPWALVNALVTDARLDWEECEKKSNDSA